jgi:LacI family transcriptional regulator
MVKRPTIEDLAKAAGVSVATVDRVLNRRLPVREDTAIMVVQAAEAIGYHATSLLKRRLTEVLPRKFAFLLQKPDAFYQLLGKELTHATKASRDIEGKCHVEFIDQLVPAVIAQRIRDVAPKFHATAVVAMDHPLINEAVADMIAAGHPVFTMLGAISSGGSTGHIGLDGRKCGRIAGWTISHMAGKVGKIGMVVGSHGYLHQEHSEISFRTYMREHAPDFQLLEPIINLDDEGIAYDSVTAMIKANDDLVGIYVAGGGQEGLIRALRERTSSSRLVAVCNELTAASRQALIDDVIDMALATPIEPLSKRLIEMMVRASISADKPRYPPVLLPPSICISENI